MLNYSRLIQIFFVALFFIQVSFAENIQPLKNNRKNLGEKFVKLQLKDPESARFQNQHITPTGNVCGEVNAKNSYGGYIGFYRYIFIPPNKVIMESADKESDMGLFQDVYWKSLCE